MQDKSCLSRPDETPLWIWVWKPGYLTSHKRLHTPNCKMVELKTNLTDFVLQALGGFKLSVSLMLPAQGLVLSTLNHDPVLFLLMPSANRCGSGRADPAQEPMPPHGVGP